MQALGIMMMELMNKESKEGGVIGINDPDRWPSDGKAFNFLSATTSEDSIDALKKVSSQTKLNSCCGV